MVFYFPEALINRRSNKYLINFYELPDIGDLSPNRVKNDVDVLVNFFLEHLDVIDVQTNVDDRCQSNKCPDKMRPNVNQLIVLMEQTFNVEQYRIVIYPVALVDELIVHQYAGNLSTRSNEMIHQTRMLLLT